MLKKGILLTLIFAFHQSAKADWTQRLNPFSVEAVWNAKTQQRYYSNGNEQSSSTKRFQSFGSLLFESPFSAVTTHGTQRINHPVTKSEVRQMVEFCKKRNRTIEKVACASWSVRKLLSTKKFKGYASFCRSHASAFLSVFNELGIPKARSEIADGSFTKEDGTAVPHVVNKVLITGKNGLVYSYVLDVGWFPNRLFPVSSASIRHHDRNGDGVIDRLHPPEFPSSVKEIHRQFRPVYDDEPYQETAK